MSEHTSTLLPELLTGIREGKLEKNREIRAFWSEKVLFSSPDFENSGKKKSFRISQNPGKKKSFFEPKL